MIWGKGEKVILILYLFKPDLVFVNETKMERRLMAGEEVAEKKGADG